MGNPQIRIIDRSWLILLYYENYWWRHFSGCLCVLKVERRFPFNPFQIWLTPNALHTAPEWYRWKKLDTACVWTISFKNENKTYTTHHFNDKRVHNFNNDKETELVLSHVVWICGSIRVNCNNGLNLSGQSACNCEWIKQAENAEQADQVQRIT